MKSHNGGQTSDNSPTYSSGTQRTQVSQRHYDPEQDAEITAVVVFAIADAMDVAPRAVKSPPVYECVDLAALEATFFGPDVEGASRQGVGTVEFEYNEYTVAINSDGWIYVYEATDSDG